MSIRVAMIADCPAPGERIDGGVQAVTSYLVNALASMRDVDLHVIRLQMTVRKHEVVAFDGFVMHRLPIARGGTATGFAKDQVEVNRCLSEIRPHLVHSQGSGHLGVLAKRSRYPVVVTVHGIPTREARFQSDLRTRARTAIQGWMGDYYCIRRGTHTILISPYVADHYGTALKGKKYLIPNPVDARFFEITRNETPGRILFAGRVNKRKGLTVLAHAAALLRFQQLEIVVAGSTSDKRYFEALKKELERLNILDKFRFLGVITMDELLQELGRCACLVLPSYQETAPMVIQEAMAAGVPIVASNVCGIPYQVEDGTTGFLVAPGNAEDLAEKLERLLSSPALRAEFGRAAKQHADTYFRATAVAERTLNVYREMV